MSGIYIPDKELPESCGKCFIDMITDAFPACKAAKNYEEGKALIIEGFGSGERPANCPLVPAADVRPVVLCRDCYAYRRDKELAEAAYLDPEMYCGLLRCEMGEDSFCSYGKRKGEKT